MITLKKARKFEIEFLFYPEFLSGKYEFQYIDKIKVGKYIKLIRFDHEQCEKIGERIVNWDDMSDKLSDIVHNIIKSYSIEKFLHKKRKGN